MIRPDLSGDFKVKKKSVFIKVAVFPPPPSTLLQTNKHHVKNKKKTLQTETDSKCRLSKQFDETAEHITLACSVLAK